jgi:hypothetical protein
MKYSSGWNLVRALLQFLFAVSVAVAILWAAGALFYDLPGPAWGRSLAALGWTLTATGAWFFIKPHWTWRLVAAVGFCLVVGWWLTLQPQSERDWKEEVAVLASAEVEGDVLTIHNLRNFDYKTADQYVAQYETRRYDLRKLVAVDIFLSKWRSELMGHPIASFDFGDDGHLAFSIEIRPEKHEEFDVLGSVYRKFELIYVAADERDVVRVRTNIRPNESVTLYRVMTTPEHARARLLEYVARLNALHRSPEWYNVITANCTTSIRAQRPQTERIPWDWRILLNGNADKMLYDHGGLDQTLPFAELKRRSLINTVAKAADHAPYFSARIREGLPGFTNTND